MTKEYLKYFFYQILKENLQKAAKGTPKTTCGICSIA